jgi:sugar lactone lactonase YvrE
MSRRACLALVLAVLAAGCNLKGPTTSHASKAPVVTGGKPLPATSLQVKQTGDAATLTGKVKIISDNGGGIISDNGGGIISNNSGAIVSNNGSGLVSNNGGGLTSKVKFALLGAAAHEFLLADAVIGFYDASGRQLQDEAGKPITATTDAQGNYRLQAVLPPGNLVMRIQLHSGGALAGGELSAMLVPDGTRTLDTPIDTVSSLGAAYVLGKYVDGDQRTFDKLPATEAARLRRSLDAASSLLAGAPKYQPAALVAATEDLRAKAPAVDKTLEDIQALLLGQANLGNGQLATDVALSRPSDLALMPDGALLVGEPVFGRIRKVGLDGTLSTVADLIHGTAKRNFPRMDDMLLGPDGSIYVAADPGVYRIMPDGTTVTLFAGATRSLQPGVDAAAVALPGPATAVTLHPIRLGLGTDGTIYVGEHNTVDPPRVVAIDPAGQARQLELPGLDVQAGAFFGGIRQAPDGTLFILYCNVDARYRLLRLKPGGRVEVLASGFTITYIGDGGLALAPDGTAYVCEQPTGQLWAVAPDGQRRVAAGPGGPPGTEDLVGPHAVTVAPDGTVLVADAEANLVHALAPDGRWYVRAGTTQAAVTGGGNLRAVSLDSPEGGVFDPEGRLYMTDFGANAIKRLDGDQLVKLAGGLKGNGGDGGPAVDARLDGPTGLAWHDGELYVLDAGNRHLRVLGKDGTIRTIAGNPASQVRTLEPGRRVGANEFDLDGSAVAVDARGRVYWTGSQAQVYRLADGQVEQVAGKAHDSQGGDTLAQLLDPTLGDGGPAKDAAFVFPTGLAFDAAGDLYVADTGAMRIRKITGLDGPNPTIGTFAGLSFQELLARADGDPLAGDGQKAKDVAFFAPAGLAFDAAGNLFVGELGTITLPLMRTFDPDQLKSLTTNLPPVPARVRRIGPDGTVHNVAGPRAKYFPDLQAEDGLILPAAICVAPDGRLAIVDTGANLVRILPAGAY